MFHKYFHILQGTLETPDCKDWNQPCYKEVTPNIVLFYYRISPLTLIYLNNSIDAHPSSFYVTYIVFSIPGTLLTKAILPSMSIAIGCLIWSIGACGMVGAHSYSSIIVCCLFIGLGEVFFGQAVTFHYSLW